MLRTPYKTQENGVVLTRSEIARLPLLSKSIDKDLSQIHRRKIVECNQSKLSRLSVERVALIAASLFGPKDHNLEMLSIGRAHEMQLDPQFEPKTFGPLFYQTKALLSYLQREEGAILFKQIVPKGQVGFRSLFKPSEVGGEFIPVLKEKLSAEEKVVVIEATTALTEELLQVAIRTSGLMQLVLQQAALQPPYHPTSTLDQIQIPSARKEIEAFRESAQNSFEVDHIYLSRVGLEAP